MPLLPAAVAVMPIGPPAVTQVAIPVFGSRVATLWSDEDHCAATFACVVGAESNVPVALKGTVPSGAEATASLGCTDKAINCRG